jgi:hypothetical protein
MITSRVSKFSVGLLTLAVAFLSVSFVTSNNSLKNVSSNTYLPLPPGKQTQLYNATRGSGDFYQRHSDWNGSAPVSAAAYSDYAQRHPELSSLASLGQGASDYAERHPELSAKAALFDDRSDYYFRHLDLRATSASSIDLTDYYFRHSALSSASARQSIDLTDYYFRHINDQ